jgi:hypothetical protein
VPQTADDSLGGNTKGEVARLKKDVRNLTRERDDALYRLEQVIMNH